MPRIGVNWGSSPDISGSTRSLGEALASVMNGGGNNSAAAQSRAMRDQQYAQSQDMYRANMQSQIDARQANDAREAADQSFKQGQITDNQGRAGRAADSTWMAQDERIKPAGIGVLNRADPAIVEYDNRSRALRDQLDFAYRAPSTNPENNIGAGNQAIGGDMQIFGGQNEYVRGNSLQGHNLNDKSILPGANGSREPVPVGGPPVGAKPRVVNGMSIIPDPSNPSGFKAVPIPGLPANGQKPTAENLKAAGFVPRLEDANRIFNEPGVSDSSQNWSDRALDYVPLAGRYFQSEDYKRLSDAEKDMVTAVLRDESGATIGDSEFARDADKYFPRYGDSQQVLADKANRRRIQIENMRLKAGPALPDKTQSADGFEGGVTVAPDAPPHQSSAPGQAAPSPSSPAPGQAAPSKEQQLLNYAQEAIAAGADPKAVMQRLQGMMNGGGGN